MNDLRVVPYKRTKKIGLTPESLLYISGVDKQIDSPSSKPTTQKAKTVTIKSSQVTIKRKQSSNGSSAIEGH